jgi:hypothetical protein
VFVKSRSVKGTSTVTKWLYSRVKGVEKTQFNIKVESFENSGYGGYTDVELKERFLIIASEVPAVYDKIEDKIIELDRSLYNVSLNAYLKGTNNAGLAFDDSSQVIYQNKVYTKIHEKYRKKDISVTKIDFLNDRWFIANVSVRQRFINSDFVVYDLQSDRLHSLSSVQVDPIQYYIPLCNENVIIVEQPLNSSKSFFWFFNNGQRIAKNWDEYSKLPEKYQYSEAALDSMGIQPTKTK